LILPLKIACGALFWHARNLKYQGGIMSGDHSWFAHYPAGVPQQISSDHSPTVVHIFEQALARYGARPALESFGKLEELFPESHVGYLNCGQVNILNHSYKDAVADYEKAIAKDDCPPSALGDLVHVKRQICDWEGILSLQEEALDGLRHGKLTAFPFNLLAWTNDAQLMKKSAELFCERMHPLQKDLEALVPAKTDGRKIRVGYFSADFSEHATMILMARFFEIHDKSKFELFGFPLVLNAWTI
jgi:predicted O-linked N-acetylglucosamine transferase (SPINDLY family)